MKIKKIFLSLFFFSSLMSAQQTFTDGFNGTSLDKWTFVSNMVLCKVDSSMMHLYLPSGSEEWQPTVLMPQVGSVKDFNLTVWGKKPIADGVALFKVSGIAYLASILEGDSIRVVYQNPADSSENILYSKVLGQLEPDKIYEWSLGVTGASPDFHIEMKFSDIAYYSGDVNGILAELNEGMTGLYFWGSKIGADIDSVNMNYTPTYEGQTDYYEEFSGYAPGWFIINDEGNTEFKDGKVHIFYSADTLAENFANVFLIPPYPAFGNGWLEAVATGEIYDGESYFARVNGTRYIVAVTRYDSIYIVYNDNFGWDYEPLVIASDTLIAANSSMHKFKMEFNNTADAITVSVNLDDLTIISGEIPNPSDELRYGTGIIGFSAGYVDWYLDSYKQHGSPVTSLNEEPYPAPNKFKLYQNYPNPFNPTTVIKYGIPEPGTVLLKVYDILGREVATLVNENKSPGNYEAHFDASGLTSGLYFYKLSAGNFTSVKKMLLLK